MGFVFTNFQADNYGTSSGEYKSLYPDVAQTSFVFLVLIQYTRFSGSTKPRWYLNIIPKTSIPEGMARQSLSARLHNLHS